MNESEMPPSKKIAILFMALGEKFATQIMKGLDEQEIKKIMHWLNSPEDPSAEMTAQCVKEFYHRLKETKMEERHRKSYLQSSGNPDETVKSPEPKDEESEKEKIALQILQEAQPKQLGEFLGKYSAKNIVKMMVRLEPARADAILNELPSIKREEVLQALPEDFREKLLEIEEIEKTTH